MPIYWTLKSIPELAQLSRSERGRAWRRAYPKTFRHWQTWAGLLACAICVAVGSYFGGMFGYALLGAALGLVLGDFILRQAAILVARRYHADLLLRAEAP